ncbi:MAG: LysR family transcriptional regulator [Acidimicrobiaceae bacterium]|nr:LysR family transcriptional regulator [Acidimicrobiaceae bacterium]MDE0492673.1 LysR family transcriptional regulator [Acidimicrobiaceae bacterium]MDE0664307.1 LysR family transcriptional regulator [Acidimicrobiaceae bacterium]MXY09224.1 LysR family transcriptional regulator [Acidimicrobiaceae bacterium]MXZ66300.1 LysR family transcriptional regulator [Acidimicrobiaceae bacterium]
MDVRQLNVLLAVAEHQSFSAAAQALHTVQSNVSAHISRLEHEAGATLIDRARRCLTPEGQVVADRARRIQLELQAISDDLASMRANLSGTVTVGVIGTTARWIVPLVLDEVGQLHQSLEVVILDATTTSLVPLLVQNRLDLAVVNLPVEDPDIETADLFSEHRVVITPADHELAQRDRIDLAELARYEILLPPKGTAFRDEIDTDARRVRVELRSRAEIDGLRLLASLAFAGFAPALLPASATYGASPEGWRSVKVDRLSPRLVGLARNRRTIPAAPPRAVADAIRRIVDRESVNQPHIHALEAPSPQPAEIRSSHLP